MVRIEALNFKERAFDHDDFKRWINKGHTYVICSGGACVGYCVVFVRSNSRIARIHVISVDPQCTGQGLGTHLLEMIHSMYSTYDAMQLEVNMLNVHAIRLYERMNYVAKEILIDYYGIGSMAIRMIKSLK